MTENMPKKTKANMKTVKTVTIIMYLSSVFVAALITVLYLCGVPVFEWESSLFYPNNNEEEREIIVYPAVIAEYAEGETMPTVKDFLLGAMTPVGKCLYIYGGGWNEEDTGAGDETMTYGISPRWVEFFDEQDKTYEQEEHEYEIHNGLDCTGFLGYSAYQVFGDRYSDDGYVFSSGKVGDNFLRLFGGTLVPKTKVTERKAGDILVRKGHVMIVVGECDDGSVLLLHATIPCVTFSGTPTPDGREDSESVALAKKVMKTIAPEAFGRYSQACKLSRSYLTDYDKYSFPEEVLPDPDGLRDMTAEEVVAELMKSSQRD